MRGCPPPELIARYLEDRLFLEERVTVEEHAADCSDCLTVLTEAIRFIGREALDPEPARFTRRIRAAVLGLAVGRLTLKRLYAYGSRILTRRVSLPFHSAARRQSV